MENKYKFLTYAQLKEIGEELIFDNGSPEDDEEIRLVVVAYTEKGDYLVQADVKDLGGVWDSHIDMEITTGFEDENFLDIDTGEEFEDYCGYGLLISKETWEEIE